jgi:hypothetical protein
MARIHGLLLAALMAAAAAPRPLAAQDKAGLLGRVHDARTGEALVNAQVLIDGRVADTRLSSQARFVITGLEPGRHRVDVRAVGYRPLSLFLQFGPGQTIQRTFELEFTGEHLPDIEVEGRMSKTLVRFEDFERRMARGIGHFITRDEIRNRGYMNMGDALRTVRGVRVSCGPIECIIRMARSEARCFPAYWVDGVQVRSFAVTTPISDVQGIEVYRGSAEAPGEFTGSTAGCGVIVIWTRAAP